MSLATNVAPLAHHDNTAALDLDEPNREEIARFVGWLHEAAKKAAGVLWPDGMLQMTGLHREKLDGKGKPLFTVLARFKVGETELMAINAEKAAREGWNVYVEPRLVRADLPPVSRGQSETDTRGVFALVVDVDAYKGENPAVVGHPSIIVRSSEPDNAHRWYAFSRLLSAEEATKIGERMRKAGGDANTGNPVQPYRLAGTPNFPTAAKRAKHGRTDSPTRIVEMKGAAYRPEDFAELWPAADAGKDKPAEAVALRLTEEDVEALIARLPPRVLEKLRVDAEDTGNLRKGERSAHFYHVTGELKSLGFSKTEAQAIWEAHPDSAGAKYMERARWPKQLDTDWEKLAPPFDPARFLEEPLPVAAPESALAVVPTEQLPPWVEEMNRRHCMVPVGSKMMFTDVNDEGRVDFRSAEAMNLRYLNQRLQGRNGKDGPTMFQAWLGEPGRYSCTSVRFDPNGLPSSIFNLWRGFPRLKDEDEVDASGAGCALILNHMHDIVCSGNEEHFAYLIRWLAHLVQHPGDKPGVAVILKGDRGVGKDTLGAYVGRIFPANYVNVSNQKQFFGNFNAHLTTALLIHAEELAWQGSKQAESALKALITANDVSREGKGTNVETGHRSFARVLATSNEDWVVPAAANERRYFVLKLSAARMQDHGYFGAIAAEMNGAGPAALRKYLEAINLTGFEVRAFPKTEALSEQKRESLEGFDLFWNDLLEAGDAFQGEGGASWEDAVVTVEKGEFFRRFERWARERRLPPISINAFGIKVVAATGLSASDITIQPSRDGKRVRHYRFPPVGALRSTWEARFR